MLYYPQHNYLTQMSNNLKEYRCNIIFDNGIPARQEIIEAVNPIQARELAERRFGGRCGSANQVG